MRAKHYILNELIFFSVRDGKLQSRVQYLDLLENISPDRQVRSYLNWETQAPVGALLHSTSWRHDEEKSTLIITWAIYPDPNPDFGTSPVDVYSPGLQKDAVHPAPKHGEAVASVAHAARHFAFLSKTDPAFLEALSSDPELTEALLNYSPAEIFKE